LRVDRAGGQVQVLGLWWEDSAAPRRTEGFVEAMRDALRAYLHFGGATRLEWAPAPRDGETTVSFAPLERRPENHAIEWSVDLGSRLWPEA
jgi:hypothetical protein